MKSKEPPGIPRLFALIDGAALLAFRVGFGLLMAVLIARYFLNGWIAEQYYDPSRFFSWPGLAWIRPWPRPWMEVHFAALGVLALFIAAGLYYRVSIVLFGLGFTYAHLIDKTNYLNHYYLISLVSLLMALMPLGGDVSLDAWRRPSRARPPFRGWMLWILRFQIGAVYFFAAISKLEYDWLFRAQPLRLWLSRLEHLPLLGPILGESWTAFLLSWGGAAFDLSVLFLLFWGRTRTAAFVLVVAFHAATALLFPIGLFPWIMTISALVFFPPDWPRRLLSPGLRWLRLPGPAGAGSAPKGSAPLRPAKEVFVCGFLAAYVLFQAALPLRSHLYGGDVLWTEEGFRLSWRVMLIEKSGSCRFFARNARTGSEREISPAVYLTPAQSWFMSTQPDMIRDFACMLQGELEREEEGPWEIRAEALVSLNGRPSRPMIDPRANLAAVPYLPGRNPWILPAEEDQTPGLRAETQ